jgi:hypothetical protein
MDAIAECFDNETAKQDYISEVERLVNLGKS